MFEFLKRLDRIERYLNLPMIENLNIENNNLEITWRNLKDFEVDTTEKSELLTKIEKLEKEIKELKK